MAKALCFCCPSVSLSVVCPLKSILHAAIFPYPVSVKLVSNIYCVTGHGQRSRVKVKVMVIFMTRPNAQMAEANPNHIVFHNERTWAFSGVCFSLLDGQSVHVASRLSQPRLQIW